MTCLTCPGSFSRVRVWFPELVYALRSEWRSGLSWAEFIALRDRLDDMLKEIQISRNLLPPLVKSTVCPDCGGPMAHNALNVSVRAIIYALIRFGIASKAEAKILEKSWAQYRLETGLDHIGKLPHA